MTKDNQALNDALEAQFRELESSKRIFLEFMAEAKNLCADIQKLQAENERLK